MNCLYLGVVKEFIKVEELCVLYLVKFIIVFTVISNNYSDIMSIINNSLIGYIFVHFNILQKFFNKKMLN